MTSKIIPLPCKIAPGQFRGESIARFSIDGEPYQTIVSSEFIEGHNILLKIVQEDTEHFSVKIPGEIVTGSRFSNLKRMEVTDQWLYQIRK